MSKYRRFSMAVAALGVLVAGSAALPVKPVCADVIRLDLRGVDPQFQPVFQAAADFWQSRITGFSDALPRYVQRQLQPITIAAFTVEIDGEGGILGQAGPVDVLTFGGNRPKGQGGRRIAIAQTAIMEFDIDDLPLLQQTGALFDVILHEMAHAMGWGSLWVDNELLFPVLGQEQYIGQFALNAYREESGNKLATFVPVEQFGGPGTALSHWDSFDPFFNPPGFPPTSELMIGFIDPGNETKFVSESTWAGFADLWFEVQGINPNHRPVPLGGGARPPNWWGGGPTFLHGRGQWGFGPSTIPEPGTATMAVLALGGFGLMALRRRRRTADSA